MTNRNNASSSLHLDSPIDDLARSFDAVDALIAQVRPDQWSAPTPCANWTVRALVDHLIGMNRVFIELLAGQAPPQRPAADHVERDPVGAYRDTAAALLSAFTAPGVLDRDYQGPLGSATGAERLQIRLSIYSRTAGISRDRPGSVPSCRMTWLSGHLPSRALMSVSRHGQVGSVRPKLSTSARLPLSASSRSSAAPSIPPR